MAERIAPPRNPGEFDLRSYLARQDVYHGLLVRYAENGLILAPSGGHPIWHAAQQSRNWMQAALSRGLEDSPEIHGLISGMVLGARDETPDEIEEQFQQTGTLHLFAVSGLNVAIVAQLLWIIASALRVPRRWAIALIIPALFFYAAITGLNTSSVRAALMGAILLGGFFVERKVLPDQQRGGRRVSRPLLRYQPAFLDGISTLLRGRPGHYRPGRAALPFAHPLVGTRSFSPSRFARWCSEIGGPRLAWQSRAASLFRSPPGSGRPR